MACLEPAPPSSRCTLRVYAEASGPVVALILVTHTRAGADVREFELPYLLWESMGTRAATDLVVRFYRQHQPEALRRLGTCVVHRRVAACLHSHQAPHASLA